MVDSVVWLHILLGPCTTELPVSSFIVFLPRFLCNTALLLNRIDTGNYLSNTLLISTFVPRILIPSKSFFTN
jgi:hypothetical protein